MNSALPECILFDLDGTLLDSLPGIEASVQAAFQVTGLPLIRSDFRNLIGPPVRKILSLAGNVVEDSKLNALERAFREHYDSVGWRKTRCFRDAQSVLHGLREVGHSLFIVSNKPRHISERILEREGIAEYFKAIVNRDSRSPTYSGKPEMIRVLLKEQNLMSAKCLLIGDTIDDASASAETGIAFLFAAYGYGAAAETSSLGSICRIDSLSRVLELARR